MRSLLHARNFFVVLSSRTTTAVLAALALLAWMLSLGTLQASDLTDEEQWRQNGLVIKDVDVEEPVIALTFDDGPDPLVTPTILEILAEFDAHATFFALGRNVAKYPEVARAVVAAGHELANHSYTHRNLRTSKREIIADEIDRTDEVIFTTTGQVSEDLRPPFGEYDSMVVEVARELGHRLVLWSYHQDTRDWCNPGVDFIVRRVLSRPQPGDIVIFHDAGGGYKQTLAALPKVLKGLKEKNFRFVTVKELLEIQRREMSSKPQD